MVDSLKRAQVSLENNNKKSATMMIIRFDDDDDDGCAVEYYDMSVSCVCQPCFSEQTLNSFFFLLLGWREKFPRVIS